MNNILFHISEGNRIAAVTDARGHTTTFEYDWAGRLTKETDHLGYYKTFTYDPADNLGSRTDESNNTTWYSYDPLNRLTQTLYPDGTIKVFGYDVRGNMTSVANSNIDYIMLYDFNNRLTGDLDSNGRSINYQYNGLNNRSRMTTLDNRVINYFYDTGNRFSQIVTGQGPFNFSYDPAGRRTGLTYPNGVTTSYTYNPVSYLTDVSARKTIATVNSFSYTHDAVGNRLSLSDSTGLHTYQYDPIYQLIQAIHPVITTEQFSYDPVGNRQNAEFDEIDGLKVNTAYTYDYENKLTRIQYVGMDAQYKYDPFGRRIEKNVNGQIIRYVYDGDNILNEYDGAGNIKSKYVFNLAIDDPLSVEQAGSVYYYHKDGLGSVTELTNSTGSVVKTYRYNSFGEIYSQTGTLIQSITFTGREYDSESGLYYYRARYFDPAAGIFIGKDPIGFGGGDVNLFRYVKNNPDNFKDPMGLFPPYRFDMNAYSYLAYQFGGPYHISVKIPDWLVPPYGKYGGPGRTGIDEAIDSLDDCFKKHDTDYRNSGIDGWNVDYSQINDRIKCDNDVKVCISKLSYNPLLWGKPPPWWMPIEYATTYRIGSQILFWLMSR